MQESWINLYCNECGEKWEAKVSDLPEENGDFRCKRCDHEASIKEFLYSGKDLEIYESFKQ
ncbi:MAG: hypothetical protein SV377_05360 [Halobacteria archaeon]|nr:hypothetical protein [Halobacteria archaeon]